MLIFDRSAKRLHRIRAARRFAEHDFLHREIAERLLDRLADIRREFPLALLQGGAADWLSPLLDGRFGIRRVVGMDMAGRGQALVADEDLLPLAEGRFDLALCLLNLHWVNDLPGALVQLRRALKPDGLLLAAIGLKDAVVVAGRDAVLVADKARAADVKQVVDRLKAMGRREATEPMRVYRPWGWYEDLAEGPHHRVKRLWLHPGGKISLQKHGRRSEHWVVVHGEARVTRGEETFTLLVNQSTYIAAGQVHRLENAAAIPLEIIEVQSGDYVGEDDIVRLDDIYGR